MIESAVRGQACQSRVSPPGIGRPSPSSSRPVIVIAPGAVRGHHVGPSGQGSAIARTARPLQRRTGCPCTAPCCPPPRLPRPGPQRCRGQRVPVEAERHPVGQVDVDREEPLADLRVRDRRLKIGSYSNRGALSTSRDSLREGPAQLESGFVAGRHALVIAPRVGARLDGHNRYRPLGVVRHRPAPEKCRVRAGGCPLGACTAGRLLPDPPPRVRDGRRRCPAPARQMIRSREWLRTCWVVSRHRRARPARTDKRGR